MIFKKIRKGHVDLQSFLCSTPARDYVFQKEKYVSQIDRAAEYIRNADSIIVGAGAGASTTAGLQYEGRRFTDNFAEFIEKYGGHYMTDMYAAGFDENRIFATQGDYGKIQCQKACHPKLYDAEELFHKMDETKKTV